MSCVRLRSVTKEYMLGKALVPALRGVTLDIDRGELVCVAGPSGSGKTTLLHLMGCLDNPTAGELTVLDKNVAEMSDGEACRMRGTRIGFIFQSFSLIEVLSVFENVEYPLLLHGWPVGGRRERVEEVLAHLGLKDLAKRRPTQLSGGQRQRVAIARALAPNPDLILADEPTANLDSTTGHDVIDWLSRLNGEYGITIVFASHDPKIISAARRNINIVDGLIASDVTL
ncbi:MAG: ABC transporter ATP-binding protein [Acidobacteria bacterium]|nr:ABC transporter ATP-binding protein [Acidobacteriota bacterium]